VSLSRACYSLLALLALPWVSLLVLWRALRDWRYASGWVARFGGGPALAGTAHSIWVHAVSVGEVQAAGVLLAALRTQFPDWPLAISSATPAGRERARALAGVGIDVRYAPYDIGACVRGSLRRLRPALLVIMETELWPNLLAACADARVPVLIASARLSERSLRRLNPFPGLLQPALRSTVTVAAQSTADAQRFVALGVPSARVSVCGNVKFDRTPGPELRAAGSALRQRFAPARLLWVAGSTHRGEEQAALEAHRALRGAQPDALLVLAPRHRPRFDEVAALLQGSGLAWLRYSQVHGASAAQCSGVAVLLLDTIGDLESCYAAADLAFVGGSLVPVGGHNLLEPAALGVATITGPYQSAAAQVASVLSASGAVRMVGNRQELTAALLALAADEAARHSMAAAALAVAAANRGALQRLMSLIRERLELASPQAASNSPPVPAPRANR
jgi:3-deoxy-D-manno-octulosonic-acid transferase